MNLNHLRIKLNNYKMPNNIQNDLELPATIISPPHYLIAKGNPEYIVMNLHDQVEVTLILIIITLTTI